jgi:hypothetical protein
MMDYYSQFPAPDLDAAKREIIAIGNVKMFDWSWLQYDYRDELVSEAFIHSKILDENNKIKFSFSGWHTFGKNDVMESIDVILEQRRKDKLRRKVRGLLRTTYLLIKTHRASIEKLYHPDSQFVKNVLKTDFEKNAK